MFSYTVSILGVELWATTEHHRYFLSSENIKSLYAEAHVSLGGSQLWAVDCVSEIWPMVAVLGKHLDTQTGYCWPACSLIPSFIFHSISTLIQSRQKITSDHQTTGSKMEWKSQNFPVLQSAMSQWKTLTLLILGMSLFCSLWEGRRRYENCYIWAYMLGFILMPTALAFIPRP